MMDKKKVTVLPKQRFGKAGKYKMVAEDSEFVFPELCPYCSGELTYRIDGLVEDENGFWKAEDIESECSTAPGMDDPEWEEWINTHSQMPYVNQLPVDQAVKQWINKRFRFNIS